MKIVVTGGRKYADRDFLFSVLDKLHAEHGITEVAQGGANGADDLAWNWAAAGDIPCKTYHADWTTLGKMAGPLRNERMLTEFCPDAVVAFVGGRGTMDCIDRALRKGIRVIRTWEMSPDSSTG